MSDLTDTESGERRFEILLVEDQQRHRRIYEAAITENLPATVTFAGNGKEALEKMRAPEPPDLVVLDLEMPELRGEEVLTAIKADHRLRYTPVIILTGLSGYDKQMELLEKGADDFIEKGATPEILIARLRAQMRHKLAVDRLERVALDRDLFAAGVLQDIGSLKWTIVSLCRHAKESLDRDVVGETPEILGSLDKLCSHASKLGAYASDVIQSVRETHRAAAVGPQNVQALFEWVAEVLATADETGRKTLTWTSPSPLRQVLADKSFLRLALLNVVQYAQRQVRAGEPLALTVTQTEHLPPDDPMGRRFATTRLRDNTKTATARELSLIFRPYARDSESGTGYDVGLALVPKVMAKMGGRAWAEQPADGGPGTVMCLDLPLAD